MRRERTSRAFLTMASVSSFSAVPAPAGLPIQHLRGAQGRGSATEAGSGELAGRNSPEADGGELCARVEGEGRGRGHGRARAGARALDWRRVECVRREKERERGCGGRPAAEWRRTSWCGRAGLSAGEQGEQGCLEERSRAATSAGGNGAGRESRLALAQLAGPPSTTTRCRSTRPSCTSAPHQNTDTHSHNCRTPCADPPMPSSPRSPRPSPAPKHTGDEALPVLG